MTGRTAKLASGAHNLVGLILLGLGLATTANPDFLGYYGVVLVEPEARLAMRAILGGGEIGLGLALTFGRMFGASARTLNMVGALVMLSVGLVRICAAFVTGEDLALMQPLREGLVEVAIGGLASTGWAISQGK